MPTTKLNVVIFGVDNRLWKHLENVNGNFSLLGEDAPKLTEGKLGGLDIFFSFNIIKLKTIFLAYIVMALTAIYLSIKDWFINLSSWYYTSFPALLGKCI